MKFLVHWVVELIYRCCRGILSCALSDIFPLPLSLYFPLFISVMGTCFLRGVGAHGWVVKFASH